MDTKHVFQSQVVIVTLWWAIVTHCIICRNQIFDRKKNEKNTHPGRNYDKLRKPLLNSEPNVLRVTSIFTRSNPCTEIECIDIMCQKNQRTQITWKQYFYTCKLYITLFKSNMRFDVILQSSLPFRRNRKLSRKICTAV